MKKWLSLSLAVIAIVLLWRFEMPIRNFFQKSPQIFEDIKSSVIAQQIQSDAAQIFAPPPLTSQDDSQDAYLTNEGVIEWTNTNRAQNGGLAPLKENAKLDQAAEAKLKDMFAQQYFEHENPQGRGPADLAKTAVYDYISIGENLALGNFKDDQTLVTAWMNSPGHRANILNTKFLEIGVAVGEGEYQGKKTWLAVQEFGRPATSCPIVDGSLKLEIQTLQSAIDQLGPQLTALKNQMDAANPKTKEDYDAYNAQVQQYNDMVKIYNNKVDVLKLDTGEYNDEVKAFNACLGG